MRIVYVLVCIGFIFCSCSKDEFSELKFEFNPYDSVDLTDAILVTNTEVAEYIINTNGVDTSAIKFYFDFELNEKYFLDNNINKPKFEIRADFYVNNIRFIPRLDATKNRYYILEQYKHFKDKNNLLFYKMSLYKNPADRTKRKICSNQFYFRVN